jgi:hypothetical protein
LATNAATADDLWKSIMRPTSVSSGVVAGNLPGGDGSISYYVAVDLQPGTLMAQLAIAGRPNAGKKLTFELLNAEARVAASTYVMAGLDPKAEATKSFAIDSPGRYIIRLTTEGKETGTYCVLMGGPAMPNATAASCPSTGPVAPNCTGAGRAARHLARARGGSAGPSGGGAPAQLRNHRVEMRGTPARGLRFPVRFRPRRGPAGSRADAR